MHELLSLTSFLNDDSLHLRSWIDFMRPTEEHFFARLQRVRRLLPLIPPLERDVIELHFFHGKGQEQIGFMLGLTQQAVSYRVRRALVRLAYLLDHPKVSLAQVRRDLLVIWPDAPATMPDVIARFTRTSSKTETARGLGLPVPLVRRHLVSALVHFNTAEGPLAKRYAQLLARLLASKRSILCEVVKTPCAPDRTCSGGREPAGRQCAASTRLGALEKRPRRARHEAGRAAKRALGGYSSAHY